MDRIQGIYHTKVEVDTNPKGTCIKIFIPKVIENLEAMYENGVLQ